MQNNLQQETVAGQKVCFRLGRRSGITPSYAQETRIPRFIDGLKWVALQLSGPLARSTSFNEMGHVSTIPTIGALGFDFGLFSPTDSSSVCVYNYSRRKGGPIQ